MTPKKPIPAPAGPSNTPPTLLRLLRAAVHPPVGVDGIDPSCPADLRAAVPSAAAPAGPLSPLPLSPSIRDNLPPFVDTSSTFADRLALWARAFDEWLAATPTGDFRHTRAARIYAWLQLLQRFPLPPWEIDAPLLDAHFAALRDSGIKEPTLATRRQRILSFYRFCITHPPLQASEPLLIGAVRTPFTKPGWSDLITLDPSTGRTCGYVLRSDEVRRLLRAVDRSTSLLGKRDYAILITILLTGLSRDDLCALRWSQILLPADATAADSGAADPGAVDPGAVDPGAANSLSPWGEGSSAFFAEPVRANPPSPSLPSPAPDLISDNSRQFVDNLPPSPRIQLPSRTVPLHPAAWQAIHTYLRDSGRISSLAPGSYIFAPLRINISLQPPTGLASDWDDTRPFHLTSLEAIIRKYATWAGLDAARLTYQSLRLSGAALKLDQGDGDVQGFLDIENRLIARGVANRLAQRLGERGPRRHRDPYGPRPRRGPYQRRHPGGQPGGHNALFHGLNARKYSAELTGINISEIAAYSIDSEIALLRVILRRAFGLAGNTQDVRRMIRFVGLAGTMCTRIAKLVKMRHDFEKETEPEVVLEVKAAIQEIMEEMGW